MTSPTRPGRATNITAKPWYVCPTVFSVTVHRRVPRMSADCRHIKTALSPSDRLTICPRSIRRLLPCGHGCCIGWRVPVCCSKASSSPMSRYSNGFGIYFAAAGLGLNGYCYCRGWLPQRVIWRCIIRWISRSIRFPTTERRPPARPCGWGCR